MADDQELVHENDKDSEEAMNEGTFVYEMLVNNSVLR